MLRVLSWAVLVLFLLVLPLSHPFPRKKKHSIWSNRLGNQSIKHELSIDLSSFEPPTVIVENRRKLQTSPNLLIFDRLFNEIVYDNWVVNWGRDFVFNRTTLQVSQSWGYYGTGIGTSRREVEVNTGWGNRMLSWTGHGYDNQYGLGYTHHNYGVRVDQDFDDTATGVEVVARAFEYGGLHDQLDQEYGQRIRLRDFEISLRHDFNDVQDPQVGDRVELATEFFVGYRTLGVSVGSDVNDTEVGVSVGYRGHEVTVLTDFDELQTDMQANWGLGWQLLMNGDFADPLSNRTFGRLGFGRLGRLFIAFGAGFDHIGVPETSIQVEGRRYALGFDLVDDFGVRTLLASLSIGKFSYVWESVPNFINNNYAPPGPFGN